MKFSDWFQKQFGAHDNPVVYVFRDKDGNVLYVGTTTKLRLMQRMASHHKLLEGFEFVDYCELLEFDTREEAAQTEQALIRHHKPIQNIKGNERAFYEYHGRFSRGTDPIEPNFGWKRDGKGGWIAP